MAKKKVFQISADEKVSEEMNKAAAAFGSATGKMQSRAQQAASGMGASFRKMKDHWMGITAAIGAAVYAVKEFVDAFAVQERAENRLAKAMANAGQLTRERLGALKEYAAGLQQLTTYGDEVIMQNMALLQSFGMNEEQLKRATMASLDLASGMGIDLSAAVLLVGKAFAGETSSLSRYGIMIEKGLDSTQKYEAAMTQLEERFGGSAQADIMTYAGKIEQLYNWFGDLKEMVGKELIITFEGLAVVFDLAAAGFYKAFGKIAEELGILMDYMGTMPGKLGAPFRAAAENLESFSKTADVAVSENL